MISSSTFIYKRAPQSISRHRVIFSTPQRRTYASHDSRLSSQDLIENEIQRLESTGGFRMRHTKTPFNTFINITPQQECWVIERLGKFNRITGGGLQIIWPIIDKIAYRFSMKEEAIIIPNRSAITQDNVRIHVIGVLFFRVTDPQKAAYGASDPIFGLMQLAQTTLRSILGELSLDQTFNERHAVNQRVVNVCNDASKDWGILCIRHEIREIIPPDNVIHAMEKQMEAERQKRVDILHSEGKKQSEINNAEGQKQAIILQATGEAESIKLEAEAEAQAIVLRAKGAAEAIERLGISITATGGREAFTFQVANRYIEAFEKLAKETTSMIVPSTTSDLVSMIAQATTAVKGFKNKEKEEI